MRRPAAVAMTLLVALVPATAVATASDPLPVSSGHKLAAVVNGEPITVAEVDQHMALMLVASGARLLAEDQMRLRLQALNILIDATLMTQAARRASIDVADQDVQLSYRRVARDFGRLPDDFTQFLVEQGTSEAALKRQLRSEIAWSRLFHTKYDHVLEARPARGDAANGWTEYRLGEIFLSATTKNDAEVNDRARKLADDVRSAGSFTEYSRRYSETSHGGDLGWIRSGALPDSIRTIVRGMTVGAVAGPIKVQGGYSIVHLLDKRALSATDRRNMVLDLRQLSLPFVPRHTAAVRAQRIARFTAAAQTIRTCDDAVTIAKTLGGEIVDNDDVPLMDLPPQLQNVLIDWPVGKATAPFGSMDDGNRVLILCSAPKMPPISRRLDDTDRFDPDQSPLSHQSHRYLRDLRRDSVIEYR